MTTNNPNDTPDSDDLSDDTPAVDDLDPFVVDPADYDDLNEWRQAEGKNHPSDNSEPNPND